MKKNNEGYVLAMVMAVIAVLAVVASAMLAVGLRNVKTQQAAIERIQAKYEVEGTIEMVVAELSSVTITQDDAKTEKSGAQALFKAKLERICDKYDPETATIDEVETLITKIALTDGENEQAYKCEIEAENETNKVNCQIELEYQLAMDEIYKVYIGNVKSIKYISYETSTTEIGGAA